MNSVFKGHVVICNWNSRGKGIVFALKALCERPIVIVSEDPYAVVQEVGSLSNVFVLSGSPAQKAVLEGADVRSALSVLVLAAEGLGRSADALSVQIALMVEKIQVTVYTVVELLDIRNKGHFAWTKVDDLVADQDLSVKLLAQGLRHIAAGAAELEECFGAVQLLGLYRQLVDPHGRNSQLFGITFKWSSVSSRSFSSFLMRGVECGVLPVALVGYREHEVARRPGDDRSWVSWKIDVCSNPPPKKRLCEIWPVWPGEDYELGVIVLARDFRQAQELLNI